MLRKSAKFAVLAYSVTSFTAEYTHQSSRRNFIGVSPPVGRFRKQKSLV
jgi:hypothetical protein